MSEIKGFNWITRFVTGLHCLKTPIVCSKLSDCMCLSWYLSWTETALVQNLVRPPFVCHIGRPCELYQMNPLFKHQLMFDPTETKQRQVIQSRGCWRVAAVRAHQLWRNNNNEPVMEISQRLFLVWARTSGAQSPTIVRPVITSPAWPDGGAVEHFGDTWQLWDEATTSLSRKLSRSLLRFLPASDADRRGSLIYGSRVSCAFWPYRTFVGSRI